MSVQQNELIYLNRERVSVDNPQGSFIMIYWKNLRDAAAILTASGLSMYIYFIKENPHFYNEEINNKLYNREPFIFSPSDAAKIMGIARNSAINGFDNLIKNNYIRKSKTGNHYVFSEIPFDKLPNDLNA